MTIEYCLYVVVGTLKRSESLSRESELNSGNKRANDNAQSQLAVLNWVKQTNFNFEGITKFSSKYLIAAIQYSYRSIRKMVVVHFSLEINFNQGNH